MLTVTHSVLRDASCWPLWGCACCLFLHLVCSHLHVRVLSSYVVHAIRPCPLFILFVYARCPCVFVAMSSWRNMCASPTLWNCCPKLEHSLFHLKWRGNGEIKISTTINHRRRAMRVGTNAVAVMGTGTDGDTDGQNSSILFAAEVRVRMKETWRG